MSPTEMEMIFSLSFIISVTSILVSWSFFFYTLCWHSTSHWLYHQTRRMMSPTKLRWFSFCHQHFGQLIHAGAYIPIINSCYKLFLESLLTLSIAPVGSLWKLRLQGWSKRNFYFPYSKIMNTGLSVMLPNSRLLILGLMYCCRRLELLVTGGVDNVMTFYHSFLSDGNNDKMSHCFIQSF